MSGPLGTPIREQLKAVTSGVATGLAVLVTALADGAVTPREWAVVALAAVTSYGAVFGLPNLRPPNLPT